jgi:hypothetical protein
MGSIAQKVSKSSKVWKILVPMDLLLFLGTKITLKKCCRIGHASLERRCLMISC